MSPMSVDTLARRPGPAGPRRGAALGLALLLALAAGCAKRQLVAPTTATPAAVSTNPEIAELEKTIAENKALLRGGGDHAGVGAAAESAPSAMASGAPSSRCDGVCRAAQEICTASRRICQISLDLADAAITASCQRSERTCNEAGALCAQCR